MLAWREISVLSDSDELEWCGDPAELLDALASLLELVTDRPAWHARAACRGQGPAAWFPDRGVQITSATSVCVDCAVREECLAAALELVPSDDFGVWGGLSAQARKRLRRTLPVGNTAA